MKYEKILKELREELHLTQEDVANILNIDRKTYNHYEVQEKIIPIKHLVSLSNYFHVSIDYILGLSFIKQYDQFKDVNKIQAGQRLVNFRKEQRLTQIKLAKILNTTFSSIAFNEKGRNLISTPFLYTICKKYNISADYLLGKIDSPKYLNK